MFFGILIAKGTPLWENLLKDVVYLHKVFESLSKLAHSGIWEIQQERRLFTFFKCYLFKCFSGMPDQPFFHLAYIGQVEGVLRNINNSWCLCHGIQILGFDY